MNKISLKLFGCSKKQVEEYLQLVQQKYEGELSSIREIIQTYKDEKTVLAQEISKLQVEKSKQVEPINLLEFARERTKKVAGLINSLTSEDIQNIEDKLKQDLEIHKKYLADVEDEIQQTKTEISKILKNVLSSLKMRDSEVSTNTDVASEKVIGTILSSKSKSKSIVSAMGSNMLSGIEDISGKTVMTPNGLQVGKVGNVAMNNSTNEIEGFYLSGEPSRNDRFIHADLIIAVKKSSLVVSADWQKESLYKEKIKEGEKTNRVESLESKTMEKMTADGVVVPELNKVAGSIEKKDETIGFAMGDHNYGQLPNSLQNMYEDVLSEDNEGEFWQISSDFNSDTDTGLSSVDRILNEESVNTENRINESVDPILVGNGPEQNEKSESELKDNASPAVEKEINTVRNRYIVGKLAGEDLLDSKGIIIIRKKQLITAETVNMAEQEGKLPELIINMVIPGLED